MINTINDRFTSETPIFWKKVGNWCLYGGSAFGILVGAFSSFLPVTAVTILVTLSGAVVAIGKTFSTLTTTDNNITSAEIDSNVIDKDVTMTRKEKREFKREIRNKLKSITNNNKSNN
jgi:hypothetical protein